MLRNAAQALPAQGLLYLYGPGDAGCRGRHCGRRRAAARIRRNRRDAGKQSIGRAATDV